MYFWKIKGLKDASTEDMSSYAVKINDNNCLLLTKDSGKFSNHIKNIGGLVTYLKTKGIKESTRAGFNMLDLDKYFETINFPLSNAEKTNIINAFTDKLPKKMDWVFWKIKGLQDASTEDMKSYAVKINEEDCLLLTKNPVTFNYYIQNIAGLVSDLQTKGIEKSTRAGFNPVTLEKYFKKINSQLSSDEKTKIIEAFNEAKK